VDYTEKEDKKKREGGRVAVSGAEVQEAIHSWVFSELKGFWEVAIQQVVIRKEGGK